MRANWVLIPLIVILVLVCGVWYFIGPDLSARIWYARETARLKAIRENLPHLKQADKLSTLLREVSKAVKPAVVEIRVLHASEVEGSRRFDRQQEGVIGSGVILDGKNGYVVTNEHVVRGAKEITVVLADKRELTAQWVRSDGMTDLAIIKIAPEKLLDIPLGDSDEVEVGDLVLAIGSPSGLRQTVTFGMISAKGRMYGRPDKYQNYLQTDAAINHGNSGGPLINMSGEIIGINDAIVSRSGSNAGLGLAIPSNMVKRVTKQLIEDGRVTRGFIGLAFREIDQKLAALLKLPHPRGALVTTVIRDGPAAQAGIKIGDFIISVNSQPVSSIQEIRHIVADITPGETIPIEFYRDGETMILSAKIIRQPDNMSKMLRP
ncbi:MAG: PDZ domain-containing protein [bacterium]|nr:PDZ domain-containing protein [bacterium]